MTKMTKEEIRILKSKHRLELVMQDFQEVFEVDAAKPDQWHSKTTPGLTVDIRRQMYEIKKPGMDTEAGDVYDWLQRRNAWGLSMAFKYLKKRAPDPKQKTRPAKLAKGAKNQDQLKKSDFVTITNLYTDPETGAKSYGIKYNYEIMDNLQQRALDVAGDWVIKYFTKSSNEIWQKINELPRRFKMIVDFEIEKCARCETPFNWKSIGMFAYAGEEEKYPDFYADCDDNENLEISVNMADPIFCDVDFVICEKCLRGEYVPRYKALRLVWRSALRREEAREEEQRQRDHEAWIEAERERERAEERMDFEAALPP